MKILNFLFIFLFLPVLAHAQVSVTASINPQNATMEDELTLTVSVKGSQDISDPVLPPMPAFKAVSAGTSSSIQIINGNMSASMQYTYILVPQVEGSFTIDPISVSVEGQEYKSQPLAVTIGKSSYAQSPQANPYGLNQPQVTPQTTPDKLPLSDSMPKSNSAKESRDYWITAVVNKSNPFINEQILYTFKFYTRVRVGDIQLTLPEFNDFWSEEVVPEKKYYEEIGGDRFVVSEKVIALFPLKVGKVSIPETQLKLQVPESIGNPFFDDPFFGASTLRMKNKNLKASAIDLDVKDLPEPKGDRYTGLVGHFHLETTLDPQNIKAGDTATLTYKITGDGNVKDAILPWDKDIKGFKIYEDKPTQDIIRTEKGVQGSKTFKRALVPLNGGTLNVPEQSFTYLNPDTGQYEALKTNAFDIAVEGNVAEPMQATGPDAQPLKNKIVRPEDIATIHTDVSALSERTKNSGLSLFFLIFALGLPPIVTVLMVFLRRAKVDREKNANVYRQRKAYQRFRKTLDALRTKKDPALLLDGLMGAVRDYFGDHWGLYGAGLTVDDILPRLEQTGVDRQKMEELRQFFSLYETWKYGHTLPSDDVASLASRIGEMIKVIDRRI